MKLGFWFVLLLLFNSCGLLKDVSKDKSNEKIKIIENTNEWKRQQGDVVFLPQPKTINKVFKDTIINYVTDKGSKVSTSYDKEGNIDNQIVICPDSEETKQINLSADYSLREKKVEKQMNNEIANTIGKWIFYSICSLGFFICISVLGRTLILQK